MKRFGWIVALIGALVMANVGTAKAGFQAGVGGHYWLAKRGVFDLTLTVDTPVVGPVYLGGRFGALFTTEPFEPGVPLDLAVRLFFGRVYLEGLFGPWIFFEGETVRLHGGLGFGVGTGRLRIGLEVGWLDPNALVGLNIATTF